MAKQLFDHPQTQPAGEKWKLPLETIGILIIMAAGYALIFYSYRIGEAFAQSRMFLFFSIAWWLGAGALVVEGWIHLPRKLAGAYWIVSTVGASVAGVVLVEAISNREFYQTVIPLALSLNVLILAYFTFCLQLLTGRKRLPIMLMATFCAVFGIANYYVRLFKGNLVHPNDLSAWKTGLAVAGEYHFVLSGMIALELLGVIMTLVIGRLNTKKFLECQGGGTRKQKLVRIFAGACGLALGIGTLYAVPMKTVFGLAVDSWDPDVTYRSNGCVLGFIVELQEGKKQKPKNYDEQAACERLAEYGGETAGQAGQIRPTLICIMNETYADLAVLGDIDTSEELERWNAIDDYVEKGHVYVSVLGGGTCNSELEFLTGNSMANVARNVYPYQRYDLSGVYSIPRALKDLGYSTTAFHPGYFRAWNRDRAYPALGFDAAFFRDDVEQKRYVGQRTELISDEANYAFLLDVYAQAEKPAFLFNVTIQNHSPYDMEKMEGVELVDPGEYEEYSATTAFRSLMKRSSEDFYSLIEYFRQVEEPVVICMFGDHLPWIDEGLTAQLDGAARESGRLSDIELVQRKYATPYMIWANYDTGVEQRECMTSANYLGAHILNIAGISTYYTDYLLDLEREIPAINVNGYQTADRVWHGMWEEHPLIQEYSQMEYYMFTR